MILIVYLSIFNYPGKSMCLSKNRSETHSYIHGQLNFICVKIQIQTDKVSKQNISYCCLHLGTYVTLVYLLVSPLSKVCLHVCTYAHMHGWTVRNWVFKFLQFLIFELLEFLIFKLLNFSAQRKYFENEWVHYSQYIFKHSISNKNLCWKEGKEFASRWNDEGKRSLCVY